MFYGKTFVGRFRIKLCSGCFKAFEMRQHRDTRGQSDRWTDWQREDSPRSDLPPSSGTPSHPAERPEHTACGRERKQQKSVCSHSPQSTITETHTESMFFTIRKCHGNARNQKVLAVLCCRYHVDIDSLLYCFYILLYLG